MSSEKNRVDYYEFLQISPRADQETIHRVYRFLASRFHPDNPDSGNAETFSTLKAAYETLSDPARRAEYDARTEKEPVQSPPLSSSIDFMDSAAGELNRRLAVLAVLYVRRRANPRFPEVSLAQLESRMGFPRDYLDFTTWYLLKKGYITKADNSDFTLTASGVDFVEMQRANLPVLNRLLTNGADSLRPDLAKNGSNGHGSSNGQGNGNGNGNGFPGTQRREIPRLIMLPDKTFIPDRRKNNGDRRSNRHDHQLSSPEERLSSPEERRNHG